MDSYLDFDEFKARTKAPASLVDGLHIPADRPADRAAWRAFVEAELQVETSHINARLFKRYAVPFTAPLPIVLGWLTKVVTVSVFEKRGWDPSDAQAVRLIEAAETAVKQQEEAANSETGLYELPLRTDPTKSAVTKGGPLAYSEGSPYPWTDRQRARSR